MPLTLSAIQGIVSASRVLNGSTAKLRFTVENLRQAPTGIHGKLAIYLDEAKLAWDTFNIERDGERTRLANAAHKNGAGQLGTEYSADFLRLDLADFCDRCWDTYLSLHLAQDVAGDAALATPTMIIDPFLVQGGGTIMFGPPKTGKSYIQLAMALSVHYGKGLLWPVKQANAMLVNLERSEDSVKGRLAQVAVALGLPANSTLPILTRRGWPLAALEQSIAKSVAARGTEVLFVDSLSRGGFGDMIAADKINPGMDTLNRLVPTWHALAHSPRADSSHVYGGVFWDAAADVLVQQHAQEEPGKLGIGLTVTASNHTGKAKQQIYAFIFQADVLVDIRCAAPEEFPELEAEAHGGMLAQIIDFLRECDASTATIMAKELQFSRVKIVGALKNRKLFVKLGAKTLKGQMYGLRSNVDEAGL